MSGECEKCLEHTLDCKCKQPRKNCRPQTEIDWSQVAEWLKEGSNGVQVAARLGICADTLYRRCEEAHGMTFTAYSQEKRATGDSLLHAAQFKKALRGDSQMLKHLGEWRLGQKEVKHADESTAFDRNLVLFIGKIAKEDPDLYESLRPHLENQQPLLHQGREGQQSQIPTQLGTEGAL
jgi:hypothetical protein